MSIKRLLWTDFHETKRYFRNNFETEVEVTLEEERDDGFAEGMLMLCDDIDIMTNGQKETLRLDSVRKLDKGRDRISELIEKFLTRSSWFIVMYDMVMRIGVVAALLAMIFRYYQSAIALFIFVGVMFLLTIFNGLFAQLTYILTLSSLIFNDLLEEYHKFGRNEAALALADYRNFSNTQKLRDYYVFTTSHKKGP